MKLLLFAMAAGAFAQTRPPANYDEGKAGGYTLPDPLAGVRTAADWKSRRRAEILALFERHVYGRTPPIEAPLKSEIVATRDGALNGAANWRQIRIWLDGRTEGPAMDVLLVLPASPAGRVPVWLGLNFNGNHATLDDPAVPDRGTSRARGSEASRWQMEMAVKAGYGVATIYYGDLFPDRKDGWADSVIPRVTTRAAPAPDDWNAIGAWAWGLKRATDFLTAHPAVDAAKIAIIGHSRLGKTALWAGAQDERVSLVVSNNSGEGGAALSRRNFGETIEHLNLSFPHWFSANYKQYSRRAADLPVDQHMLLALIAPRPLYVASATEDQWADPKGEFLAAVAADPVYRLMGKPGLGTSQMPPANAPTGKTIGYHLREGKHDVTRYDWEQFLAFAKRHWGR